MPEKKESTELVRIDPQNLISMAIKEKVDVGTMERLVALAKDIKHENSRDAWYQAMNEFHTKCPIIKKSKEAKISTKGGGSFGYKFSPLDEILSVIRPIMGPLGLTVSWETGISEDGKAVANCVVRHNLGHQEKSGKVAMPILRTDYGATPAQQVGIAMTYARRYSLMAIMGIAPEDDTDAGDVINERRTPFDNWKPPAKPTPPPEKQEAQGIFEGKIVGVKKGATYGKDDDQKTLWYINGTGGEKFGYYATADPQTLAVIDEAQRAAESKANVILWWTRSLKGNRLIDQIETVTE